VSQVLQHELDFGIAVEPFKHQDLVITPISKEYVGIWSVHREPKKKVVYYNPEMIQIVKTLKNFKDYKKVPVEDYENLASIVSHGKGAAILPSPVAARHPKLKPLGKRLKTVDVCLIYRYDILKTPATDFILKTIKESCK
jgi:DNA-binding transcriptional LysR family regulator